MNKDLITSKGIYKYSYTNKHNIDMYKVSNGHMSKELIEQRDRIITPTLTVKDLQKELNNSDTKNIQKKKNSNKRKRNVK